MFDELAQFYEFYVTLWIVLVLRLNDRAEDQIQPEYGLQLTVDFHSEASGERQTGVRSLALTLRGNRRDIIISRDKVLLI